MTAIDTLLAQPAVQAVGWALLHFIWQGTLVALLAAAALVALRRSAPDVRYVVATIALSLMLTMPVVTAVQAWRAASVPQAAPAAESGRSFTDLARSQSLSSSMAGISSRVDEARRQSPASEAAAPASWSPRAVVDAVRLEPWLPILVLGWCCGVAVLTLRLLSGWLWVQRMKHHDAEPMDDGWQIIAKRLCRRLHIARRVHLVQSRLVDVPTVIGWMKPVILLPASVLAGLTPHQLEAILAHELAHIRRHDYLVNLMQTLVETLLFYHPAVWWLSRRIREERENCCDDLAVSLCGDPYTYAQALADLEELRGSSGRLVLAASGGSLLQRVRRLLGAPSHAGRAPGWLAGAVAILVMSGIVAGAIGSAKLRAQSTTTSVVTARPVPSTPISGAPGLPSPAQLATTVVEPIQAEMARADEARARAREEQGLDAVREPPAEAVLAAARAEADEARASVSPVVVASEPVSLLALRAQAVAGADLEFQSMALAKEAARSTTVISSETTQATSSTHSQKSQGNYTWSNNGEKLEVKYDGEFEFSEDDTDVARISPNGSLRIRHGGWTSSKSAEFTADASGKITRRYWVGASERPYEPEGRQWMREVLPRFIRQTGIGAPARVARILKSKGPQGVLAEISLIEGSWAKRIYFSELLATPSLDANTVRQAFAQAGREIDSDYELASLLIKTANLLNDDTTRKAYFDATRSIASDYEMRRVFASALKTAPVAPSLLAGLLETSQQIESDYEEASLLVQVAKLQPLDGTTRPAFFAALATVGSDYEHRRVLTALAERGDAPQDVAAAMLDSAAKVSSDFEAASFLVQIAKQQPIEGSLRAPFFRAVDSIQSAYERGRVLQTVARRPDTSQETVLSVLKAARTMNGSNYEASQVLLAVAAVQPITGEARDVYVDIAEKLGDYEQGRALSALVKSERRK